MSEERWRAMGCESHHVRRLGKTCVPIVLITYLITHLPSFVSVTNHAGRVVTGDFGGVTNGTFVVSGKAYPLSILPKDEQTRLKALAGQDVRTAREKRLDRARELKLERIRLREEEGEIDRETAERLRRDALGTGRPIVGG